MKLDLVLMYECVKNLAKVVFIFKRVNNEVITGFKVQLSQKWSCKAFWGSKN